jgi:hypothetical protein
MKGGGFSPHEKVQMYTFTGTFKHNIKGRGSIGGRPGVYNGCMSPFYVCITRHTPMIVDFIVPYTKKRKKRTQEKSS